MTGRSWVRVVVSSHYTCEGKTCHGHPSSNPTQSRSSLHCVRPFFYSSLKYRKVIKGIQAHIKFLFPHLFHSHPQHQAAVIQTKRHSLQFRLVKGKRSRGRGQPLRECQYHQANQKNLLPHPTVLYSSILLERCLSGGQRNQATIE